MPVLHMASSLLPEDRRCWVTVPDAAWLPRARCWPCCPPWQGLQTKGLPCSARRAQNQVISVSWEIHVCSETICSFCSVTRGTLAQAVRAPGRIPRFVILSPAPCDVLFPSRMYSAGTSPAKRKAVSLGQQPSCKIKHAELKLCCQEGL